MGQRKGPKFTGRSQTAEADLIQEARWRPALIPHAAHICVNTKLSTLKGKRGATADKDNFQFHSTQRLWTGDMPHIPTQQGHTVRSWWPARASVCVWERVCVCVSGMDANTTDACGFPPGPQTLTSLSPKRKHETKCLSQNKQCCTCSGSFGDDGHAADTVNYKTACWTERWFFWMAVSSSSRESSCAALWSLNASNKQCWTLHKARPTLPIWTQQRAVKSSLFVTLAGRWRLSGLVDEHIFRKAGNYSLCKSMSQESSMHSQWRHGKVKIHTLTAQ